jgi:Spy/CpxP family protein refolding chaperone
MTMAATGLTHSGRMPRPRWIVAILAISIALNLCFVAGALWTRLHAPPMTVSERFHRLSQTLGLSPAQQTAFDQYVAGMISRGDRLRQATDPLMAEAWTEVAKPEPDQAKVFQLLDEASAQRHQFQRDAVGATLSLLATLTPEQRARFIAAERERREAERRRHIDEAR